MSDNDFAQDHLGRLYHLAMLVHTRTLKFKTSYYLKIGKTMNMTTEEMYNYCYANRIEQNHSIGMIELHNGGKTESGSAGALCITSIDKDVELYQEMPYIVVNGEVVYAWSLCKECKACNSCGCKDCFTVHTKCWRGSNM